MSRGIKVPRKAAIRGPGGGRIVARAMAAAAGLLAPAVQAADALPPGPPREGGMLLAFAAVVALVPVALWAIKRLGPSRLAAAQGLRIAAQLPLGRNERLVAVDTGERWLLLAISPSGIRRVGTMPRPDAGSGTASPGDGPPVMRDFASLMSRMSQRQSRP